jgi:hypothetical protein
MSNEINNGSSLFFQSQIRLEVVRSQAQKLLNEIPTTSSGHINMLVETINELAETEHSIFRRKLELSQMNQFEFLGDQFNNAPSEFDIYLATDLGVAGMYKDLIPTTHDLPVNNPWNIDLEYVQGVNILANMANTADWKHVAPVRHKDFMTDEEVVALLAYFRSGKR